MKICHLRFYSWGSILRRFFETLRLTRRIIPSLGVLIVNASYRVNALKDLDTQARMDLDVGQSLETTGARPVSMPQVVKVIAPPRPAAKASTPA